MFLMCRQEESRTRSSWTTGGRAAVAAYSSGWHPLVGLASAPSGVLTIQAGLGVEKGLSCRARLNRALVSTPSAFLYTDTGFVQRLSVVGNSGSGKTTIARRLATGLGIPHLELDAVFHQPDWQPCEPSQIPGQVPGRAGRSGERAPDLPAGAHACRRCGAAARRRVPA